MGTPGAFSATAVPRGDSMTFEESPSGCEVRIRRRGPYLVINDNERCGGMNVRHQGGTSVDVSTNGSYRVRRACLSS